MGLRLKALPQRHADSRVPLPSGIAPLRWPVGLASRDADINKVRMLAERERATRERRDAQGAATAQDRWDFHDAAPAGSHLTALTSSWWPWKHFVGAASPSLHTKMRLSVEHVAKDVWLRQSTSSVGAARTGKPNCDRVFQSKLSLKGVVLQPHERTSFRDRRSHGTDRRQSGSEWAPVEPPPAE